MIPCTASARRVAAFVPLIVGLCLVGAGAAPEAGEQPAAPEVPRTFAERVDLSAWGRIAVHTDGRLQSFSSFASTFMSYVTGPRDYRGQSAPYTYLDLLLRPEAYDDADIVYVKNKPMRAQIVEALRAQRSPPLAREADFEARMTRFMDTGLLSERMLSQESVRALLARLSLDLIRTAKFVDQIESGLTVKQADFLAGVLRIVPPPEGDAMTPWLDVDTALGFSGPTALDEAQTERLRADFQAVVSTWRDRDADGFVAASESLASFLASVRPDLYPEVGRLEWESRYFAWRNMTWVWLVYLVAVIGLLLSVVYRWRAARWIGLGLFVVAFGFHTAAIGLRWYVAQRWPNTNMFEAVTTSVWFGGCIALVLEWVARRHPMRGLFALGSAGASMIALMAAHFMPASLSPNISNMMPVLDDLWLYIHTNVIIASYALIFMAGLSGFAYLVYRVFGGRREFVSVGGAGTLILARDDDREVRASGASGGGAAAVAGGGAPARASAGRVLDGVTMVLMELSFVMLWAGLVMGAIWADHSWGRPWGWDPKEVFALNTFLVFALLVHIRWKVKDKGLWTAVLAFVGAGVMLFNWIVINFVITGLHSYA